MYLGAALPVGLHGVGKGLKAGLRPFSSRLMTEGLWGGLANVSKNPQAIKILARGISKNDDVAKQYLNKVYPATGNINAETAKMVDDSLMSRINVPETIRAERANYADFMNKHGADEVLDFTPTREQMMNYPAQSKFYMPKIPLNKGEAEALLRDRAQKNGVEIGGNIDHYLNKRGRGQYVRTLSNTLENPDITYSLKNRDYFAKKYNGIEGDKIIPFNDFIVKQDGKLYTKFVPDDLDYISNQIQKNNPQDLSLRGVTNSTEPTGGKVGTSFYKNTIPLKPVVVNPDLPNVSRLYEGLTDFQSGQLDKAIKSGLSKTNAKAGSLESLNKVRQELNEQISKAQTMDQPSEAWQLNELKAKFEGLMPDNLKAVDAGFVRAKRLEDAYNQGMHYNPSSVNGVDNIAALGADEQNAFVQGLFKWINNNSATNKDLAKTALGYGNTLSQVLPAERYNPLLEGLNSQSTRFERLANLRNKAESRLRTPETGGFFGYGHSKGNIDSGLDYMNDLLRGRAIRNASINLLDPHFRGLPAKESWIVRNPALSAGFSSAAFNNLRNKQLR